MIRSRSILSRPTRRRSLQGRAASRRRRARGMTLLEVMVSVAILAMMSVLIYGAFDSLSRGKRAEEMRVERARQGREAVLRIARELTSAYLSMHQPQNIALATRITAFVGKGGRTQSRVDFSSFAHRRIQRDQPESDQAEIGYFVSRDPDKDGKFDLVRREQSPPDMEPTRGGVVNVVAEDVEEFELKFFDPLTGSWQDTWDSTQVSGQPNRLPLEVRVKLTLKGTAGGNPSTFTTKVMLPIQQPLTFGIPQQ
jgi:general secretion pathway protein J